MLEYTEHAEHVRRERGIQNRWIEQTISNPDEQFLENDGTIHYVKQIDEFGGRFLRVVQNSDSGKIITLFFDRRIRKIK